jgi:hypothetical protein
MSSAPKSPSQLAFQSTGMMNGSSCSLALFPENQSVIVACANGVTDGDAADWAVKVLMQALFNIEPKLDLLQRALSEAAARRADYERLLNDWKLFQNPEGRDMPDLDEHVGRYCGLGTALTIIRTKDSKSNQKGGTLPVVLNGVLGVEQRTARDVSRNYLPVNEIISRVRNPFY